MADRGGQLQGFKRLYFLLKEVAAKE